MYSTRRSFDVGGFVRGYFHPMASSSFDWGEFLTKTGAVPAELSAFWHVETSLARNFDQPALANKWTDIPHTEEHYWPARVLYRCGNRLLRLSWLGTPKRVDDASFWWDLSETAKLQPLKHLFNEHTHKYKPPSAVDLSDVSLESFAEESVTLEELNAEVGAAPVTCIKAGFFLEVQDPHDPTVVWLCRIVENIGGRLLLRYRTDEDSEVDFWEFYLCERLHHVGWCAEAEETHQCSYGHSAAKLATFLHETNCNSIPKEVLKDQIPVKPHDFQPGMRLEILDPQTRCQFYPATVTRIVNKYYFVVEQDAYCKPLDLDRDCSTAANCIDDSRVKPTPMNPGPSLNHIPEEESSLSADCVNEKKVEPKSADEVVTDDLKEHCRRIKLVCHKGSPGIFPIYWCHNNGLRLSNPIGYPKDEDFSWPIYLRVSGGIAAGEHLFDMGCERSEPVRIFQKGQKLETVHPEDKSKFCPATIARITKHVLWLHYDHSPKASYCMAADCRSMDLFPCGWSASNGAPLAPPIAADDGRVANVSVSLAEQTRRFDSRRLGGFPNPDRRYMPRHWIPGKKGCVWCGPVFVNASCFCGPYLNKDKVRTMPSVIGPGPLKLVLVWLLRKLVNAGNRPKDVLELLAPDSRVVGPSSEGRQIVTIKARFKARHYTGRVEICRRPAQLREWGGQILAQLDACPYLFSIERVSDSDHCPAQCALLEHSGILVSTASLRRGNRRLLAKRLRRPSILSSIRSQSIIVDNLAPPTRKRPKPVAVVEGARRPITRGVKLPKFSPAGAKFAQSGSSAMRRPVHKAAAAPVKKIQQGRTKASESQRLREKRLAQPLNIETPPQVFVAPPPAAKAKPIAVSKPVPQPKPEPPKISPTLLAGGYPIPWVDSNPSRWSVAELSAWLLQTDLANVVPKLQEEEVDGQAFMLLTVDDCQRYLHLKFGPALKLCGVVKELKQIFITRYALSAPQRHGANSN